MATYTAGSGGDYPTLQTCFASGVLASGDTVQILDGYNVDEQCSISGINNVTVIGNIADPSQCVITWSNPSNINYTFTLSANGTGWAFKGVTVNYTGNGALWSGCYFPGWTSRDSNWEDCRFETTTPRTHMYYNSSSVWRRCKFDGTNATSSGGGALLSWQVAPTLEACLFVNFGGVAVSSSGATVSNCTFYNGRADADCNNPKSLYDLANATVVNSLSWQNNTAAGRHGFDTWPAGGSSPTLTNCISWGAGSDDYAYGTQTNCIDSSGVGTSLVMVDAPGGDYYPANPGLAYHSGDPASIPAGGDLVRRGFNNPPSRGALEVIPPTPPSTLTVSGVFVVPPPNVTSISTLSVPHTLSAPSQIKDIYLGYPAMGNVVSLVSDFTGAGSAGNRLWLAKGTLGASDGEYIPICDTESNLANCLRTTDSVRSIYAVFVDHGNKRLVWDQENPSHAASGEPTKATYYIATSTGRLVPVTYYASAGAVFGKLTCPNAASASTTNDIIGANTGTATEILTSRSACFINIDA